ncbi:MAG TPA: cytochrome c, partial [Jatrophihabitans sp.]|nr:cytochrome c [Jatrophihabitans sp.]
MTEEDFEDGVEFEHALGFEPAVTDTAVDQPTPRMTKAGKGKGAGLLRRKVTGMAVLIVALTTVGGGYALLAPTSGASDTASSSQDIEQGRQLFETSCITCHGAN